MARVRVAACLPELSVTLPVSQQVVTVVGVGCCTTHSPRTARCMGVSVRAVAVGVVALWLVQEWVVHRWLLHSSFEWAGADLLQAWLSGTRAASAAVGGCK